MMNGARAHISLARSASLANQSRVSIQLEIPEERARRMNHRKAIAYEPPVCQTKTVSPSRLNCSFTLLVRRLRPYVTPFH